MKIFNHTFPVIVAILLILISLLLILNLAGKKFIERKIRNAEISSFTFSAPPEINVNLLQRKISLKQAALEGEGTDRISAKSTQLEGIHIFPLLFKGQLVINKVSLDQPGIFISKNTGKAPDKDAKNKIIIKKLEVRNGKLMMSETDSVKKDTVFYVEMNTDIWNLAINSKANKFVFQNNSFDRVRLAINNSKFFLPNKRYQAHCDTLGFDSQNQRFTAHNIHLESYYSKYEIAHLDGVETDWFDISLDSLLLQEIHLDKLLKDSLLIVKKAELNRLKVHTFRDKRLPFPEKQDTKLPMQLISSLPFKLHTDTVVLRNAYIDYAEHREDADKEGIIKFYDVNATIANLSNADSLIKGKTMMKVSSRLMSESMLEAEFVFPNNRYPERYQVTGTLQPSEMNIFNPMVMPVAFVHIKSGTTKTLAFSFIYNEDISNGEVVFEYENLKVFLLNKKNNPQAIKSFLANTFIVKKNNLQNDKSFKKGTISFERDKKKSVFNYWWKSLLSGLKDSANL